MDISSVAPNNPAPPGRRRWQLLSAFILVILWEIASRIMNKPLLLPSPLSTFGELARTLIRPGFLSSVGATLWRGFWALLISMIAGTAAGAAAGLNPIASALLKPLTTAIRTTPAISIILLALIWFSTHTAPIFIGFLIMFPIIAANVGEGVQAADPRLVQMAAVFHVKKSRVLREIYLPSIAPYFLAGLSTAAGIGWKGIIAGEALSQPLSGLGTRMQHAQTYLATPELLAWTLIAIVIGYAFETLIDRLRVKISAWR